MAIQQITTDITGEVGIYPRLVRILCDDSYTAITTADYLKSDEQMGYTFYDSDLFAISYADGKGWFQSSVSDGIITLSKVDLVGSVIVDHIACFSDTAGGLKDDAGTAINGGNIQAGLSGTAGYLSSFPSTAAKGSLRVTAVANTGDTVTTISNVAMGQASVISIPDPVTSTANFVVAPASLVNNNLVKANGTAGLVADAGYKLLIGRTSTYGGGGTSTTFSVTGLTSSSRGTVTLATSTNVVAIKAIPSTDTLTVTFSGDPGAGTSLDYIYSTAAVA